MNDQSYLHIALIYLAVINVVTFFMYGIDKWRSTSGRLLPTGRKKAKKSKWRIREAALLGLAVLGGSIGAWLILCDEKYLAEDGKPDVEKMNLITFDPVHHTYIQLGKAVGNAFADGKQLK